MRKIQVTIYPHTVRVEEQRILNGRVAEKRVTLMRYNRVDVMFEGSAVKAVIVDNRTVVEAGGETQIEVKEYVSPRP